METEPQEVNDFPIESKSDNASSAQTQRDIYHQDGSFGVGHMSGGTIAKGAQVAGTIYNIHLPQQIKNQNTPCNIKRTGSTHFVGRTEPLEKLHDLLQQNEQVTISAIAGMGGIGKTELALQYVIAHQDDYPGSLCWFSVRGKNLGTQIIEFAGSYLNLFAPDELQSDLAKVQYCWRNWRSEKSLIVLDDVSDYGKFYQENIEPYLPPATNNVKVLMTSRERPGTNIPRIDLDVLNEADALELLEKFIGQSRIKAEPDLAKDLCEWLGYLPLGLELVGRYIDLDESLTIKKTLKRLERKRLKARALLDPKQADMTAQLGVAAAFDLSWDVLSPEAQELGCYLSLFSSDSFKWSWVENAWIESEDEDEREDQIEDLEDLRNWQLARRNLIKVVSVDQSSNQSSTKKNYQLHSLIAQYFRARLEEREQAKVLKQKFCAVMSEIAKSISQTPNQEEIQIFAIAVPHMSFVATELTKYINDEDLIDLYISLDYFYSGQGIYAQAEQWLEYGLIVCQTRLGEQHPGTSKIVHNLATLYYFQGKYEDAEKFNLQALESYKQTSGEKHLNVATSLNNLAELYRAQGRYEEAERFNLQALDLYKKVLGERHPDFLISLNNLAQLYRVQGRYEEAERFNLQALDLYKKVLGEEHPDFAKILGNLADLYRAQGKYEEAESFNLQALELRKQLLGEQHLYVAMSFNNLAELYRAQGRYEEAKSFNLQALDLYKKILGEKHPDVAKILNNLALIYFDQKIYDEAEVVNLESLELYQQMLGEKHPDVAKSLNNLAGIYYYQEKYEKAESFALRALKLYEQLWGGKHPDRILCFNSLAVIYNAQGKDDKAEPILFQTIELNKQLLGEKHPNVAVVLNNLALLYFSQERYDEAEPFFLQALEIAEEVLGKDHPNTNMFRENLNYVIEMQQKNQ